jgi:hypothetical protein
MTCDEFQARYLAGEGSATLDSHLAGCAACRSESRGLARLRLTLVDPTVWETPGPDLEARIVDEVLRQQTPSERGDRRRWIGWAAGAVAVVLALLIWIDPGGPDWEVELTPTPAAAMAQASVQGWQTPTGTRMRFEIDGLAASGNDAYYEIWLTATDGRHVSGGTFEGSGVIEASIGVARREYPRVWITLEPADADLGPSPSVVFDNPGY